MDLRPYQNDLVANARAALRRSRRVVVVLPTGGGKGQILTYIARGLSQRDVYTLIVAHRTEICEQLVGNARDWGVRFGRVMPGAPFLPKSASVQIAMVRTLANKVAAGLVPEPKMIIVDECHHAVVGFWRAIIDAFPNALVLGFTATPVRLDGRGLGDVFNEMVIGPTMQWLIENGYLANFRYFVPESSQIDTDSLAKRGGEYQTRASEERATKPKVVGNAVAEYEAHFNGAPCIVFCVSINHAEVMEKAYKARGWRAGIVHGKQTSDERRNTVQALKTGHLHVLISVDVISEGFDVPLTQGVQMLRPTQSLSLYDQQMGRALRPKPDGSQAIILDHANNVSRHGLPLQRQWSLTMTELKEQATDPIFCRQCGQYVDPAGVGAYKKLCISENGSCGLGNAPDTDQGEGREVEQVEGKLIEIEALEHAMTDFKTFRKMVIDAPTTEEAIRIASQKRKSDGKPYRAEWVYRVRDEVPPWKKHERAASFHMDY